MHETGTAVIPLWLVVVAPIVAALATLVVQNWFADRRRAKDIARDDHLRNDDRDNAKKDAAAWFEGELRGRLCDDIASFIVAANVNVSWLRFEFLSEPDTRTPITRADMHPFYVALFNARYAAQRLDGQRALYEAVDALATVAGDFSELFYENAGANADAQVEAVKVPNGKLVDAMGDLGKLVDAQRLKRP